MDAELESELRDLIARRKIWQIMVNYSRGIDRFDRDLVRSCYWDDAIDDHHSFVGTADEFIDWAIGLHAGWQTMTHHCLSNHSCEIDGDDAHAETYYMFVGANNEPPHLLSVGRYVDHLQRRGGEWKIRNRVCTIERNFRIEDDPRVPIGTGDPVLGPVLNAGRDRNDLSYMRPLAPRSHPKS